MKALCIQSYDEGASNGGGGEQLIAVDIGDQRVYLKHTYSWYNQTGDEKNSYSKDSYEVVSVDEEPFCEIPLVEEVKAFLEQFAKNGLQGKPELTITQNARGKFVDGVEGFTEITSLGKEVPLNPVLDKTNLQDIYSVVAT